ncbi:hypothetical protein HN51_005343, partial [Arachis hypogaea]
NTVPPDRFPEFSIHWSDHSIHDSYLLRDLRPFIKQEYKLKVYISLSLINQFLIIKSI